MHPTQGTRLDSWKAIAEYLGRNVRTVTRWADERGMPLHRVPGGKRGAVFAFTAEIDAWMVRQQEAENHRPSGGQTGNGIAAERQQISAPSGDEQTTASSSVRGNFYRHRSIFLRAIHWRIAVPILVVVLAAAGISAVLLPLNSKGLELASLRYDVDTVEGKTAEGRTMWMHRYSHQFSKDYLTMATDMAEGYRISDFFGDGGKEVAVIIPLRSGPNSSDLDWPQIDFFTSTGKLVWSYRPEITFRFGDHELKAPWHVEDLLMTEGGGPHALWVVAAHHAWGNSFVVQLDPRTGKDTLRFVNTGNLHRVCELKTKFGTYLLFGGFNNEWDSGSLAIMKEGQPFAASPQTPGTRHHCDSCPSGDPDYYFVFPRTEINRTLHAYEDGVYQIFVSEAGIEVSKHEGFGPVNEGTVYLLRREPPFSMLSVRYNSDYDMTHRAWSAEGRLAHSLEDCPERLHPQPIRLWTPAGGWTDLPVKPARANQ